MNKIENGGNRVESFLSGKEKINVLFLIKLNKIIMVCTFEIANPLLKKKTNEVWVFSSTIGARLLGLMR